MAFELAWQIKSFRLTPVASSRRLFFTGCDGADELLQVPVPGKALMILFQCCEHAFQIVREFPLAGIFDVCLRKCFDYVFVRVI